MNSHRPILGAIILIAALLSISDSVWAQSGKSKDSGKLHDKVTAYLAPGATDKQAVITVWMSNVNAVGAISLPLKFAAADSFAVDSLVTAPHRAGHLDMPPPTYKRETQTLLVNMLRSTEAVKAKTGLIPPGEGILAVIHLSATKKFDLEAFKMAAIMLPPENVLLYVTDTFNSVQPEFEMVRGAAPAPKEKTKTP